MFKAISNAYHALVTALTDYAVSIRQANVKFRDMHGLDELDSHDGPPPSIATEPTPPALNGHMTEPSEPVEEAVNGRRSRAKPRV